MVRLRLASSSITRMFHSLRLSFLHRASCILLDSSCILPGLSWQSAMPKGCATHGTFYTSSGRLASCVFWLGYGTPDAIGRVQIRCRCGQDINKHTTSRPTQPRTTPVTRGQIMCSHCWNKLIVVSLGLAVAGVLMCAVALLECVHTERVDRWLPCQHGFARAHRDGSCDRLYLGLRQVRELLQWTARPTP